MKDCLVSIIVPIYNVEKFVGQCIHSILSQSYKNCELILVDDGSKDDSMKISMSIIDEYCSRKMFERKRVKVIQQKNRGVSSARNAGINVSEGFFLLFVDSDDWIDPEFVDEMMNNCDENADLVVSGISHHYDSGTVAVTRLSCTKTFEFNTRNTDDIVALEKVYVFNGVHRKFFKSSIIKDNHLAFDEHYSFGEDLMFVFSYLYYVNKITQVNIACYHYRWGRSDSLTVLASKYRFDDDYCQWQIKKKLYQDKGIWDEPIKRLLYIQLWGHIDNGIMSSIKNVSDKGFHINIRKILSLKEIDSLIYYKNSIPSSWIRWSVLHRLYWPFKIYSLIVRA